MSQSRREMNRREFIKKGAQLAAGAAVVSTGMANASVPKGKQIPLPDGIPNRVFGKTGVKLPVLGFGGAAVVRVWGSRLSFEDNAKLIRHAYDRGVRYFDTSRNYMESEPIIGAGLKGIRDNVFLATKVDTTNPRKVRKEVEISLKALQTDYLDLLQIHGTPGIEQMNFRQAMKIHEEVVKLKDEGIVRFVGLTGHHYFDKLYALISTGGFDQCMLAYGYFRKGMVRILDNRMLELREMCLAKAHELGMAIVSMKVLGGSGGAVLGHMAGRIVPNFNANEIGRIPGAAIRWVLNDPRIHMLCVGMATPADIDQNIETVSGQTALTNQDRMLLAAFSSKAYQHPNYRG